MYLYNIGAQKFFLGASYYNSRASVGDKGYKVWINESSEYPGSVTIKDSVETQSAIKLVFAEADGASWVDCHNQPDTLWTITQVDDNYRIAVGDSNANYNPTLYPNVYYGVKHSDASERTPVVYWNLTPDEAYVDWAFVTPEQYVAYTTEQLPVYYASEALYEQLQIAEAEGLSVTDQEAVYNNTAATIGELNTATQAVENAIAANDESTTTADNPKDKTTLITNPSYDNNDNTGWSGTVPAFQSYTDAEFYGKPYNYYQTINTLPKGVYAVTVQAFYRAGYAAASATNYANNTNNNAKLFAVGGDDDTLTVNVINPVAEAIDAEGEVGLWSAITKADGTTGYIPNTMQAAEWFFQQDHCNNQLYFTVDDGSATIGLYKNVTIDGDWTIFDNWKLTYYGKGTDAYTKWLHDMAAQTRDYSNLPTGTYVTTSLLNDYAALRNSYLNGSASTKAGVVAAIKDIDNAASQLNTNIQLWNDYLAAVQAAKDNVVDDDSISNNDKADLAKYINGTAVDGHDYTYPGIIAAKALTSDQLRTETAWVKAKTRTAIANGIAAGSDVTDKYLVNADFETTSGNNTGWISTHVSRGNVGYVGNSDNHCFEAWNNAGFDVYQEVDGAPAGVYTITVKGFYRYGRGNAWNDYVNGVADQYKNSVQIYVNDNTASFKNVFDEKVKYNGNHEGELYTWDADAYSGGNCILGTEGTDTLYWFPNGMNNAATAFKNGLYEAKSYGLVAKNGDKLRVGVKGSSNQGGDSWAVWDDFHMTYEGTNAEVVKPLLVAKSAEVDSLLNSGIIAGKTELATAKADITAGNEAADGTDGEAMFNALTALIADEAAINTSKPAFDSLAVEMQTLNNMLATYASTAREDFLNAATTLYEEVEGHLTNKDIETADARGYTARIRSAADKLRLPADYSDASADNPIDLTTLIANPTYDDGNGNNSFEGWTGPGYNLGNDSTQKAALLVEYYSKKAFDLNQTINGLPDGKYKVQVNAFYRYGTTAQDYEHYQNGDANLNAFMYATSGTDSTKTALALLGSGARKDNVTSGTIVGTEGLVVPYDMASAGKWFTDGFYVNTIDSVTVKDGKLTIGIRKTANVDFDWVILDNWKLYYLGGATKADSTNTDTADTDISKIDNALYVSNFKALKGGQTTVHVKMKNTGDVQGFQFNLYLPKGMTVAKNSDGDYDVQLSTDRTTATRTNVFQYVMRQDGSLRVFCTSSNGKTFSGTDGDVALVRVNVASYIADGDYPVVVKDIVMGDLDGTRHACDSVRSTVTIASYIRGDVNDDGNVDVVDVSVLFNHILGIATPSFNEVAADCNGDGSIDVVDASAIINAVLFETPVASAKKFGTALSEPGICSLYAAQQPGKAMVDVSICNGGTPFSAWQMDVTLPEGVSLCGVSLNGGRMDESAPHLLAYNRIGDNLYRVAFVSLDGTRFAGSDGTVVTLRLGCDGVSQPGAGSMELGNVLLSSECRPVRVADATGLVDLSTVTGIDATLKNKEESIKNKAAVYSLSGKQVGKASRRALPGGVYIVNGKKTVKR